MFAAYSINIWLIHSADHLELFPYSWYISIHTLLKSNAIYAIKTFPFRHLSPPSQRCSSFPSRRCSLHLYLHRFVVTLIHYCYPLVLGLELSPLLERGWNEDRRRNNEILVLGVELSLCFCFHPTVHVSNFQENLYTSWLIDFTITIDVPGADISSYVHHHHHLSSSLSLSYLAKLIVVRSFLYGFTKRLLFVNVGMVYFYCSCCWKFYYCHPWICEMVDVIFLLLKWLMDSSRSF